MDAIGLHLGVPNVDGLIGNVSQSNSKPPKIINEKALKQRRGEFGCRCRNCGSWKWMTGNPGASWYPIISCDGNQQLKKKNKEYQGNPYTCIPNCRMTPEEREQWARAERPPRYKTEYTNWALSKATEKDQSKLIAVLNEKKIPFREQTVDGQQSVQLDSDKLNVIQFDSFIDDLVRACPNARRLERDPSVALMLLHLPPPRSAYITFAE